MPPSFFLLSFLSVYLSVSVLSLVFSISVSCSYLLPLFPLCLSFFLSFLYSHFSLFFLALSVSFFFLRSVSFSSFRYSSLFSISLHPSISTSLFLFFFLSLFLISFLSYSIFLSSFLYSFHFSIFVPSLSLPILLCSSLPLLHSPCADPQCCVTRIKRGTAYCTIMPHFLSSSLTRRYRRML